MKTQPHSLRAAPQAGLLGKSEAILSRDITDRMAQIRLCENQTDKIRRKHGCNRTRDARVTTARRAWIETKQFVGLDVGMCRNSARALTEHAP
jgi:hypothetical protein